MIKEEAIKTLASIIYDSAKIGYIPFDTDDELCAMNMARTKIDEILLSFPPMWIRRRKNMKIGYFF